jgi:hypothetical protein
LRRCISARDIGEVKELVAGLGPKARAGTPRESRKVLGIGS